MVELGPEITFCHPRFDSLADLTGEAQKGAMIDIVGRN